MAGLPRPTVRASGPVVAVALAATLALTGCVGGGDDSSDSPRPEPAEDGSPTASANESASDPASEGDDGEPPEATDGEPNATDDEGGFSDTHVFPGNYSTDGPHSRTLREGPHEARPLEVVRLESPVDGVPVALELHRPDVPNGTPVPVIVAPSPYYGDGFGDHADGSDPAEGSYASEGLYGEALVHELVPHGYAVALLANRGTADSGGCWDTLGPETRRDMDRAITWLAEQPWSTGRVGVAGIFSQDGAAAWQAAATGNPHVETVVATAGWPDHHRNLYANGTWSSPVLAAAFAGTPVLAPYQDSETPGSPSDARTLATRAMCPQAARIAVGSASAGATGAPGPTGYWEARDLRDDILASYDGTVFLIQGLQDPVVQPHNAHPWARNLTEAGVPVKLWLGQWSHERPDGPDLSTPTKRWDLAETLLHWFDHWVKGNTSRDLGPRVQVQDTDGGWRSGDAWPPEDASPTSLHLGAGGVLREDPGGEAGTVLLGTGPSNPRDDGVAGCPSCAVFSTPPLEERLRFSGTPHLPLRVTPLGHGGVLQSQLLEVSPDGEATVLTSGEIDLLFADGGREPEAVTPVEPLRVRMALEPQDALVPEGARLTLIVSQNMTRDRASLLTVGPPNAAPGPVRLHVGGAQSTLRLQVHELDRGAAFTPPGAGT